MGRLSTTECTYLPTSCTSHGRRQGEPWGAPPRPRAPTYQPTWSSWTVSNSFSWPAR